MANVPLATSTGTNIFNFGPILDAINSNVVNLLNDYALTINKLNSSLGNENTIITGQGAIQAELTNIINQLTILNENLANALFLMEAVVQGLGNVATLDNQKLEIALLNNILNNQSVTRAVNISLDLAHAHRSRQQIPTNPGP